MPNDTDDFLRNAALGLAHGSQMGQIVDGMASLGETAQDMYGRVTRAVKRQMTRTTPGKRTTDIELPAEPKRRARGARRTSR